METKGYRMEQRPEGVLVMLYKGKKMKDHYIVKDYDAAIRAIDKWIEGK